MEPDFANLGDIKFDKDPPPKPDKTPPAKATRSVGRPSNEAKLSGDLKELKEAIDGMLFMVSMPLQWRDRHYDGSSCADMFVDLDPEKLEITLTRQADVWSTAMSKVANDNKYLKAFFMGSGDVGKYIQLALATQPFVMGIYNNHSQGPRHAASNNPLA